ncbi:MAG: YdcF family protein [Pseudomonadota bacterium]
MFFALSKIIWFVLQPSFFIPFLIAIGLLFLVLGWSKWGKSFVGLGLVLFFVVSLSPLANILLIPLEERFPRPNDDIVSRLKPDGMIILGGASDISITKARKTFALNEAGERFVEAVLLARQYQDAKVIFSGGSGSLFWNLRPEALAAQNFFQGMGLNESQFLLEQKSRNTFENAIYSKGLIAKKFSKPLSEMTFLLVTSAFHMPRAVGCFRRAGINVIPWPVDYRTRGWQDSDLTFKSPANGLKRMDVVMKEWVGLVMYWLTDKTDKLFPGRATS